MKIFEGGLIAYVKILGSLNSKNYTSIHKALSVHKWAVQHADCLQLYSYFTRCSVRITSTKDLRIFMRNVNGALDLNTRQGSNVTTKGKVCNLKAKAVSFPCQSHNYLYRYLKHTTNITSSHYPTQMENIRFSYLWSSVLHE